MGLSNSNDRSVTYLSVVQGKLSKKVTSDTEGAVKRINKLNNEVWELRFSNLDGYLTGIAAEDGEYGIQWAFKLSDGEQDFVVKLPYSSKQAVRLLSAIRNADLSKPISINVFSGTDKHGKPETVIYLKQDKQKVASYYNKENPMPDLESTETKKAGKIVVTWNDDKRMAFLEEMVTSYLVPRLVDVSQATSLEPFEEEVEPEVKQTPKQEARETHKAKVESKETFSVEDKGLVDDDLPF